LDNAKLTTYVSDANKKLTTNCQLNLKPENYKDLTAIYDIWIGSDFDRLKVNFYDSAQKVYLDLTLDLSDFDKQVTIAVPKDAKDINNLIPASPFLPSVSPYSLPVF
jgi:hypothetical protein